MKQNFAKNATLAILCILSFTIKLKAQDDFAVIKDPDGFAHVHKTELQSKIVGNVYKFQPFDCITDDSWPKKYPGMIYIEYSNYAKKEEAFSVNDNNDTTITTGYIHNSRVYRLSDMPHLKQKKSSETKAVFANDTLQVSFEIADFNSIKHVMRNSKGKRVTQKDGITATESVETIDGLRAMGIDGTVPRTEINSIAIAYKDTTISFPKTALKNIFEPSIDSRYTKVCLGPDGEIYIWMQNSDGAGSYNVIWVIVDHEVKYMYTGISWYA